MSPWFFKKSIIIMMVTLIVIQLPVLVLAQEVPLKIQVTLFMKILKYERNLTSSDLTEAKIGVLYSSQNRESIDIKDDFIAEFKELKSTKVNEITIQTEALNGLNSLNQAIADESIKILYITPGFKGNIAAIIAKTQANGILTFSGDKDYVEEGVSVGIGLQDRKPKIFINLESSRQEGADFAANLLKLAEVIQ